MKIKYILVLFFFGILSLEAQLKEYYVDENDNTYTKEAFDLLRSNLNILDYYFLKYDIYSVEVNVIVKIEIKDSINRKVHRQLVTYLNSISDLKTNNTQTILVQYFPEVDECIRTGDQYFINKNALILSQKIKRKHKNVSHYFLYHSDSTNFLKIYSKRIHWEKDKKGLLQKSFFKFHYPCGSFLILEPSGALFIRKGEYAIEEILNYLSAIIENNE